MKFAHLWILHLLWLLPLAAIVLVVCRRQQQRAMERLADSELLVRLTGRDRGRIRFFKGALLLTSLGLMLIALAGPRWGSHYQEVSQKGVDIMILVDVSPSMLVEDVKPNRLERARREILDFLKVIRGDRVGLTAFSGAAFVQCPLTLDYAALDMFLSALQPDLIPVPGTDLGAAIETGVSSFDFQAEADRVMLLITDGEDNEGKALEAAGNAAANGVKIFVFGDVTIGVSEAGGPPSFFYPYYNPGYENTGWPPQIEDLAETGIEGEYLTDRLTEEALKYLDKTEQPFFLYFSHFAVHRPHQAKEDMIEKYQVKADALPSIDSSTYYIQERESIVKTRQDFPIFAAMVESVDQSFGRLMSKLEKKGILENTIIVFTSDNGGLSATKRRDIQLSTSVLPLRAGKGWLYEGGIRVPMIIGWEGVIQAGTTSSFYVSGTDMYPTLLDLAELNLKPDQHMDALNLSSLILHDIEPEREAMFFHYPHYHPSGQSPASAVISRNYKLIRWYEDGIVELYNIAEDIGEHNNLSEKMPDLKQKLSSQLDEWLLRVNAQMNE